LLIVGLNGSPHKQGNVAELLKLGLDAARSLGADTKLLFIQELLEELQHPYCIVCEKNCQGKCYKGTSLEEAFNLISRADGLLLGSPVHFGTVSAQMKGFWDLSRRLRREKALINTVGGCVTVGAARFGGQETTIKAMIDIMLVQGMIIVGDGLVEADAGHHGACAQEPSDEDANAKKRVQILGQRLAEVAKATLALRSK